MPPGKKIIGNAHILESATAVGAGRLTLHLKNWDKSTSGGLDRNCFEKIRCSLFRAKRRVRQELDDEG
jgi:hypothetical protein